MTLIDNQTRFIVQGVTGNAAQWHLKEMLDLGQPVLAGVQPGGPREPVHGVPVFQSVAAACGAIAEPPDATLIFVPAAYAVDAAHEAIASLAMVGPQSRIVTTNYDRHLSACLPDATSPYVPPDLPG